VPQQHGFSHNGTDADGQTDAKNGDDPMEEKREHIAHVRDGSRCRNLNKYCGADLKSSTYSCFPSSIRISIKVAGIAGSDGVAESSSAHDPMIRSARAG
jgi:hypothetical protein